MNILQINSVYGSGSTGKIVYELSEDLREMGHNVLTCYGLGPNDIDLYSFKVCSNIEHKFNAMWGRITGIPFGGMYLSNHRIKSVIHNFKPDIVHVHCVNCYILNVYSLLKYLAKNHIKTVLTLHAEIFHTAGCAHAYECDKWKIQCQNCTNYKQIVHSWFFDMSKISWKKMYNTINSFDKQDLIITAVSPWLTDRVRQSTIMKSYNIECVNNGLNVSIFNFNKGNKLIERNCFEKVILFVTPYFNLKENDLKGGRYIFPIAKALPNYKFVVVIGNMTNDIKNVPNNVQIWGKAKNQEELRQLYSESDITLLLSRRETFSMVTAESLCCGTPVVGFKAGGPESISLSDYSKFVEYGDINALIDTIQDTLNKIYNRTEIEKQASKQFDSKQMSLKYYNIYKTLIK